MRTTPDADRPRHRWVWALAGVVLLWLWWLPADGSAGIPCPFHSLTHLRCPGCGATRALHALLHLRVAEAWALNALVVTTAALALPTLVLRHKLQALWARAPWLRRMLVATTVMTTLAVWAVRVHEDLTYGHRCEASCPNALP